MKHPTRAMYRVLTGALFVSTSAALAIPAFAQATYESVFDGYVSFRQKPAPIDWRAANAAAGELGGFVGQMRASPRPAETGGSVGAATKTSPEKMSGMHEMMSRHRETSSKVAP